jgi:predicted porin
VNPKLRLLATAVAAVLASAPSPLAAQAFTLPQGVGAVTLFWQYIDNTGHRLSDGYLRVAGQSVTTSVDFELDYGVTDRLSATFGIPYVFAKYTGSLPPRSGLPVDSCQCWHSTFQDFSLAARYNFGNDPWAATPIVRYVRPSHDYNFVGEATVGRNLEEVQVGVSAAVKLVGFLPKASVQAGYTYSFVEKVLDIKNDRGNGFVQLGYVVTPKLFVHADGNWQRTHGGLRIGSVTGDPFPIPGEFNSPAKLAQSDRLTRSNYWHVGGGLSYSAGPVDLFAVYSKYVYGTDTHNGQVYIVGATWYFDLSKSSR